MQRPRRRPCVTASRHPGTLTTANTHPAPWFHARNVSPESILVTRIHTPSPAATRHYCFSPCPHRRATAAPALSSGPAADQTSPVEEPPSVYDNDCTDGTTTAQDVYHASHPRSQRGLLQHPARRVQGVQAQGLVRGDWRLEDVYASLMPFLWAFGFYPCVLFLGEWRR